MSLTANPKQQKKAFLKHPLSSKASRNDKPHRSKKRDDAIFQQAKVAPHLLSSHDVLQLQSTIGNQAAKSLLSQGRQSPHIESQVVQDAFAPDDKMPQLQEINGDIPSQTKGSMAQEIDHKKEQGGNLPDDVQLKMEGVFGTDFSDVKIQENSVLASNLNALAYTQGNEIHFAPGEYRPKSQRGQEILSHELSHIIQQREGRVKATHRENGHYISEQHDLETEADNYSKIVASGGKISGTKSIRSQPLYSSIQCKSTPLQLYRSLPSGATILAINPDFDSIYLACASLARRVESRVSGNVNWAARIGRELEAPIAANRLAPFRRSFTETEGINFDWTVSISWRINDPIPVGGSSTSEVTRSGGGNVTQSSGTSTSTTDSGKLTGSVGGHEGAPGAGAEAGTSTTQEATESQGTTLQSGVSRRGNERSQSYSAELLASITVSGSANFSGSDYVNPFKWGTSLGSAITTSGAQSGTFQAGRIDYQDSRPI